MKLVKTVVLLFREGSSDKVYEVDLCEVGADALVVNFRYGRRGSVLRDGSKTPLPVPRAEAERIFERLVQSKIDGGYHLQGAPPPPAPSPHADVPVSAARAARAEAVLARLGKGTAGRSTWSLERAIWRAGEMKLRDAEPLLLRLVGTAPANAPSAQGGRGVRDYSIAWALGFCGASSSDACRTVLARLDADEKSPGHVRRIATEALLRLSDEATRAAFVSQSIERLPEPLRTLAKGDSPEKFAEALHTHLGADANAFGVMDLVYLIDSPIVRPGFLAEMGDVPFDSPQFFWVRHIFKAAEYRRDAEVFGLLALRFDQEIANGKGECVAYSSPTRAYLRRRVWRTLRRMGELGDPDYVPMAVGVLLPVEDEDDEEPDADAVRGAARWDSFATYVAFNHILYTNSPRYGLPRNRRAWRVKDSYAPEGPVPTVREEAFPELWERTPAGLMHLLAESRCAPVHDFAVRAIRACPAFLDRLDADDIELLLTRPYEPTVHLGFDLAKKRYRRDRVEPALLLVLASARHEPARQQARLWIDEQRTALLGESAFLAGLVAASHPEARAFARRFLRSATLTAPTGHALLGRLVATLLTLERDDDAALAADVTQTIATALRAFLGSVAPPIVGDLLASPIAGVRELGIELLGAVPDDALALEYTLVARLSCSRHADVRDASRPLVRRVAQTHPEIAQAIAEGLVQSLLRRKLPEGVPGHLLQLLKDELASSLPRLSRRTTWRLLQSGSPHAQELGGLVLARFDANDFELDEIAKLASHDILSVRQASWSMYERSLPRIQANMKEAVRILDAKWPDARAWAFRFFRERFVPDMFTADVLVAIVDSVRADVQGFGRELLQRCFREEDGPALLLKLSEHPGKSVQLFATGYLERYASERTDRLEQLVPYFTSVLSRVNQGRIAKARVLDFLGREGQRSEEAARLVVPIVHRLSATMAIENRGAAIAILVGIHRAHPGVPLPLRFKEPPLREARG